MVVVNSEPSTSAPKRKNRRSLQKKKSAAISQSTAAKTGVEVDQEMAPVDQEVYSPEPQATTSAADKTDEGVGQGQSGGVGDDDEVMIDTDPTFASVPAQSSAPSFPALSGPALQASLRSEMRRIPIPPHRMSPLKKDWINIFGPLTEILGLQVRMNIQRKAVEIRTSKHTKEIGSLQKGADFVKAYALGFEVNDSIALLRLDDLYLDSFEIKDVKTLQGDHLARAIGRIAGQDGKTKFTIENASRTRIVLADTKIHILGSFQNIKVARDAIVSLILGSPPGKVYAGLRTVSSRMRQRAL
ncbi:hypothetical protein BJ322DRAFT_1000682 [Thelephora terrestris]|uniref:Pre-rRNA-processing protein PNO1 n=1 Tax=Thelephora terrestris TaxID=56493 RepID=A0A9P6HN45_9AGAM|nr:hypothetical protein BJ322DRAFT_1000682 [Thelephora terrestris]